MGAGGFDIWTAVSCRGGMLKEKTMLGKTIEPIAKGGDGKIAVYDGDKPTGETAIARCLMASLSAGKWVMVTDGIVTSAEV